MKKEKLTTKKIKQLIGEWLSEPTIRGELQHHSDFSYCKSADEAREHLEHTAELFNCRKGCTAHELEAHIWKLWCDPSRWKREGKHQLREEWESYLACGEPIYEGTRGERTAGFVEDMLGTSDQTLVEQYFNDPAAAERCILRCFVPDNQLADNYRLEVVTTPEDDQIIGWSVFVD